MKRIITALTILTGVSFSYAQSGIGIPYKGIINKYTPTMIADDACADSLNVMFDETGGVSKRKGSQNYDASDPGGGVVRLLDEYQKSDGTRYLMKIVGSTLAYSSGDGAWTILCSTLNTTYDYDSCTWLDKWYFMCGGDDNAHYWNGTSLYLTTNVPNGRYVDIYENRMWVSGILNDPTAIKYSSLLNDVKFFSTDYVGKNNGDYITGQKVYNGVLYVFMSKSIYAVIWKYVYSLFDDSFVIRCITEDYGTLYNQSLSEFNHSLMFWDKKGIIQMKADTSANADFKVVSTAIDGEISEISQTIENIQTLNINTALDFGAGTMVGVDTTTASGRVYLSSAKNNQINQVQISSNAESTLNNMYQTFYTSYTLQLSTISIVMRRFSLTSAFNVAIFDSNMVGIATQTYLSTYLNTAEGWTPFDFSTYTITLTKNVTYYINISYASPGSNLYAVASKSGNPYSRGVSNINYDRDLAFKVYLFHYNENQYGQWQSDIRSCSNWAGWNTFSATVNEPQSTSIDWFVSCSTASVFVSSNNLVSVSDNTNVNISSGGYIMFFASITTQNIGESPYVDSVGISYYSGSLISNQPIVSISHKDYLFIGISTPTQTINCRIYAANKDFVWSKWEGVYPYCLTKFRDDLYYGDSAGTGYTKKLNVSNYYLDAGTPYISQVTTRNYNFSKPNQDKIYDKVYLDFNNGGLTSNALVQYCFDGSGIWLSSKTFNLTDSVRPMQNKKMPIQSDYGNRGKYLQLKISSTDYFDWYGGTAYFQEVAPQ